MRRAAILVEGVGKRFLIGARVKQADALGETPAIGAARQLGRLRNLFTSGLRAPGSGAEDFGAPRDVSFEVPAGQVLGIIGRDGWGKSTLLRILSRITPPTEGKSSIVGRSGPVAVP